MQSPNSETMTEGVRIEAAAQHLPDRSRPDRQRWFYVYKVRMTNEGTEPATLRERHWIVVDANGERRDVTGQGVVGEEPRLEPGETFEYRSFCDLSTPWGTMEGTYIFERDGGERVEVSIGRFFLVEDAENAILAE